MWLNKTEKNPTIKHKGAAGNVFLKDMGDICTRQELYILRVSLKVRTWSEGTALSHFKLTLLAKGSDVCYVKQKKVRYLDKLRLSELVQAPTVKKGERSVNQIEYKSGGMHLLGKGIIQQSYQDKQRTHFFSSQNMLFQDFLEF